MKFEPIKSRSNQYLAFIAISVFVLLCGCNADQGSSSKSIHDSGSLRFNIAWEDHSDRRAFEQTPSGDVCADYLIETITADVYNSSNEVVAWQTWDCDTPDRRGTITGVSPGSGMYVVVKAFVAGNTGDPDWKGQSETFSLARGETKVIDNVVMQYARDNPSAPSVSSHYPAAGQTGVALNPVITASFSEDVVATSVVFGESPSCTVFEANTTNQVNCTVEYNAQTVTIIPEEKLSPNLEYTVTITRDVQDLAGLQMADDYSWNFTTETSSFELHGAVESLGDGKVRITYDFSSADQILDWDTPDNDSTSLEIVDGVLKVSYSAGGRELAITRFKKELRTDLLRYDARVIEAEDDKYHINFYVRTLWDGSWQANQGYGGIHRDDGRLFTFKGVSDNQAWGSKIINDHRYAVVVTISDLTSTSEISWDVDGKIETRQGQFDTNTNRSLFLGGWRSTVLFDNIVIEGQLDE
jgi:hypothetical protein